MAKVRSRDLKWCGMECLQDELWEKPKVLIYPMAPEYDLSQFRFTKDQDHPNGQDYNYNPCMGDLVIMDDTKKKGLGDMTQTEINFALDKENFVFRQKNKSQQTKNKSQPQGKMQGLTRAFQG